MVVEDDGLVFPTVGPWAVEKHRKIGYYASVFSASMRKKWDCRLYIDLFAGGGAAIIKGSGERIKGSPLVVLGLEVPFDKYIFCEADSELSAALVQRIRKMYPDADAMVLNVNCNTQIEQVIGKLPKFSRSWKGIAFCFVDPFSASNLAFDTLRRLSASIYVDFAVLLPSHMDIHRNEGVYTRRECRIIDDLLGESQWREDWDARASKIRDFGLFIADRFGRQMNSIGYLYDGPESFVKVRMGEDYGLNLYYLCFFSKHPLGQQFWKEARVRTTTQMDLGI